MGLQSGFAMLAAFSQSSADDASKLNQKIIVGFGYTTMDPSSGKFLNIRTFADVWQCNILNDTPLLSAYMEPVAAGAPNSEQSAGMGKVTAPAQVDVLSASNANRVEMIEINYQETYEALHSHITNTAASARNIRKFVGDLCPTRSRGGLVAYMTHAVTRKPLHPEQFFTKSHLGAWQSEAAILERFRELAVLDQETYKFLREFNPATQFFLITVAWDERSRMTPGGDAPPYYIYGCFYARYGPDVTYVTQNSEGETILSQHIKIKDDTYTSRSVEVCANKGACPNLQAHMQMIQNNQCPSFNLCSRCKIVRYCSRECQRENWPEHKALCLRANPKH